MTVPRPAILLVSLLFVTACVSVEVKENADDSAAGDEASRVAIDDSNIAMAAGGGEPDRVGVAGDPSFVMGEDGSASMRTRNGTMQMSLRGDSIVVAISDSIRQTIRRELAESMSKDSTAESALAQAIQGVVKSSVSGVLGEAFGKSLGFPLSALKGIDYDQGAIRFDFVSRPKWDMEGIKTDGAPLLEQFHPADAARFVGAVRARLPQ